MASVGPADALALTQGPRIRIQRTALSVVRITRNLGTCRDVDIFLRTRLF